MVQAKALYYPQNIEDLYHGMSESFLSLAHYGIQYKNRLAFHQQENSALSLHAALPFGSRKQEIRASGWAWGIGGGVSDYLNKGDRILAPSIYFWDLMIGRGTNEADLGSNTGLLGFFEIGFRDERPNYLNDQRQVLHDADRMLPEHRHSFNFRMGARFHPLGEGLVEQHPRHFSTSTYVLVSAPYKSTEWRSQVNFDILARVNSWYILSWENSIFKSFDKKRVYIVDDVKHVFSMGLKNDFYFSPRSLFQLGFNWKYLRGSERHYISPWPTLVANFNLAF